MLTNTCILALTDLKTHFSAPQKQETVHFPVKLENNKNTQNIMITLISKLTEALLNFV